MRGSASLIVGLLAGISATMQASHLPVRIYTTADGLAANTVNRIVRDSRGFLWFCTREGLSRFDGYQFRTFGVDQGLPVSDNFLLETRRGEYWVATDYGVAKFNPADSRALFTLYRPHDPKARKVNVLVEDSSGDIWCGTTAGLYRLEQVKEDSHSGETGRWRLRFVDIGMAQQTDDDMVVEALLQDRSGTLWIGGPSGLYRCLPNGRSERYTSSNGLPNPHILSLLQDREGRLWAGTWGGLCRFSSNGHASALVERVYTMRNGLAANIVGPLLETSDGQLWIGTENGLSKYLEGARDTFENFTTANGLSENNIYSLGEDRAGNLWAGSVGVNKISRNGFLSYGTQDGLASSCINAIGEDLKGELCVFAKALNKIHVKCTFLNRLDGSRFYSILPNIPMAIKDWGWGTHQFQDRSGKWWVPTGRGLFRFPALFDPAELQHARPEAVYGPWNGLAGENIYRLFEDSRGDIWIATASASKNGLTRWERAINTLRQFSSADGLPPKRLVNAFAEDRAGCIWIGFYLGGIARFRGGHFEFFQAGEDFASRPVRALYLDDAGRMWVAYDGGLTRIDSPTANIPQLATYTTAHGLSSNNVQCIIQDRYGRIYAGTDRGVDCFYPRTPLGIRHYTTADGLVLGRGMSAFRDHQGTLWFGTEAGLSRLAPEPERPRVAPPVFITAFRVRGVPQPISAFGEIDWAAPQLAPEQNQIEVEFVGLGFGTGETLRYQYQLQGAGSADQSTPTDQRRINYAGLSPGSYHFLVRAVTSDGLFSARPATVAFTILAPVWQRPWSRIVAVLLAAALVFALYRYRVTRLLELERLRTRIATDLHDDIGSTLSQIAILSEVASRDPLQGAQLQPLSEIATLSRASVDSMSDIVWAIDPEQDRLGDLSHRMRRFASDLFSGNGVHVQFRAPGEEQDQAIGIDKRRQVFLIFKESLHNTARHSACTEVEIDLGLEKGWLALTVRDNGKGFDVLQVRKGHGLLSFDQRAKQLGGRVIVESAPGCGTTVRLRIPLSDHPPGKRSYLNG